jgi:autotransporter-associated beta strand protein
MNHSGRALQDLRRNARITSFFRKALKPFLALCALAPVFASHHASAQLYWDGPNTVSDGMLDGMGGSWNLMDDVWATSNPPPAGTPNIPWTNGNPAVFTTSVNNGGTPFSVTVDATIIPTSISFPTTTTNFNIAAGTGTLNLTANAAITMAAGVTPTISAYTNVLGNFSITNPGGNFYFTGFVDLNDQTNTITGIGALGQDHFSGQIISSPTGIGGINFIGASAPYTAFIYDGPVANTYRGLTTVGNQAFLVLSQTGVTNGAVVGNILVNAGGSLDLLASNQTATNITVTVNSSGIFIPGAGGAQFQGFELQTFSDTIGTLNGNSAGTVGIGTGTLTVGAGNFAGNIVNSVTTGTLTAINMGMPYGALVKVGPGTLTLSGMNTYQANTYVFGGTLQAGSSTGFSPNSAYDVANPGILDVNGNDPTVGSLTGDGTVTNNAAALGILINGALGANTSFYGSLQDGTGPLGLTLIGGIFTVYNSTYSGPTTVNQGTLRAGSTMAFSPRSAYTINFPGILDLNGFNNSIGSLAGTGTVTNLGGLPGVLTTGLDNTDTTFSGTIQDGTAPISLVKTGMGAMTLASSNTFTGGTILQSGALVIAAPVALGAGNVTVTGGALRASGPAIDIQVGGNYVQTGGELDLRIGGTTAGTFDRLAVVGSATLGGRLNITSLNNFIPVRGTELTIVTAGGGIIGKFAQITGNLSKVPLINLTLEYTADQVILDYGGTNFSSLLDLTPNERAVAAALDNVVSNAKSNRVLNYLEALPLKSLPAAFARIAPEEYGTAYQLSSAGAKMQTTSVTSRLDTVHLTHAPYGAGGPAGPPDGKSSNAAAQPNSAIGVFANANGEFVSVGDSSNAAGYNFASGGVTFGADYRFSENFVAGALFNYTRTRADLVDNGRLDSDAFRGGVYASLFGGGAYVNGFLGAGYSDYDMRRAGLDTTVRGDTSGGEFTGMIQTGYDAHLGALTVGPVASLQYTYTGLSDLEEKGSLDPLHINSSREQSIRSNMGVRATYDWHVGRYILTPELRATWQHEFGDVIDSATASMLFGSPNFTVTSPAIGRDSLLLNVGFTLTITPEIAAYLFYEGELGRFNYQDSNILLGVRMDF